VGKCSDKNCARFGGNEIKETIKRNKLLFMNMHKFRRGEQLTR